MGRTIVPKLHDLYGNYPKLNKIQLEYLKLSTDPEMKLRQLSEAEIAEILGIDKKSLYNYRQNPEFREAINKETMLKAADDLPDMLGDLKNMALGRGEHKGINPTAQLQAKKIWFSVMGFIDEAKQKHVDTRKEVMTSFEQRLMKIDSEYRSDSMEIEE
jgi:hypothetical protein